MPTPLLTHIHAPAALAYYARLNPLPWCHSGTIPKAEGSETRPGPRVVFGLHPDLGSEPKPRLEISSGGGSPDRYGGEKKKAWSPLGKELDSDLAGFAALSGKLDAIQHVKIQAKDMCEGQKAHAKKAQNWLRAAGEILRTSMMHGHKPMATKRTRPSTPSSDGESMKENSPVDSLLESGREMSKRT
ncbi:hypothetical protein JB92DRAFT_3128983 [Gautieria morchelliformis]|nr:hypothetical protein JB92DRAFT_3128983 [Gautieria morchelliformis]